jgi:hypothetical protein
LGGNGKPVDGAGYHDGIGASELWVQLGHVVVQDAIDVRFLPASITGRAGSDIHILEVKGLDYRSTRFGAGSDPLRQDRAIPLLSGTSDHNRDSHSGHFLFSSSSFWNHHLDFTQTILSIVSQPNCFLHPQWPGDGYLPFSSYNIDPYFLVISPSSPIGE